jgi:hypothetical protein
MKSILYPDSHQKNTHDPGYSRPPSYKISSIFQPDPVVEYKKNPYKPKDNIILGTDTIVYPNSSPIKVFEPAYQAVSAYDRKQLDLYGVINSKPALSQTKSFSPDPKQRKKQELASEVFNNKKVVEQPYEREKTIRRPFTPETRKSEMMSSSVFGDPKSFPGPKSAPKKEDFRRKNQMFSDIFGEPVEYKTTIKPQIVPKNNL